jgi:hypothetical protein
MCKLTFSFLFVAFGAAAFASEPLLPVVNVGFVPYQIDCPVAIKAVKVTPDFPYSQVALENISRSRVSSITMAVLVTTPVKFGEIGSPGTLVKGSPIKVQLDPGQNVVLSDFKDYMKSFEQALFWVGKPVIDAQLGVYRISFADGSEWRSGVDKTLSFPMHETAGVAGECRQRPVLLAALGAAVVPAGSLVCVKDSKSPTVCDAPGGQSCTMSACSCAQYGNCYCDNNCACKKCSWQQ